MAGASKTTNNENLGDLIKELARTKDEVFSKLCKVVEIDEDKNTIEVAPVDGSANIINVRLKSEKDETGFLIIPVRDSFVFISFTDNNSAFVSMYGQISKIKIIASDEISIEGEKDIKIKSDQKIEVGGSSISISSTTGKVKIESGAGNLKSQLDSLIDGLTALTVTTAMGPSGPPLNIAQFIAVKVQIGLILE